MTVSVGDDATADWANDRPRVDTGSVTVTPPGANVQTSVSVTFDKPFESTPRVFLQLLTGPGGAGTVFVWPDSHTTTGFDVNVNRSNTTVTSVAWMAVGT